MFELSAAAQTFLSAARSQKKKIVFTNGCFDILHAGHIQYLNEARSLGDLLFVGLNADISVKKLKGDGRPINGEAERKFVLENLKAVSFVEIFTEETPLSLIEIVRPNILVKGGDWKVEQIVGHQIVLNSGGEVKSLSFVEGFSTTNTIAKIIRKS
ncbi:MAG: D-beta-D-heptose 1-phosphate adenosyltransferase [Bdellovibrionales bacterium RIFOXYD12_FULL_39_22]|nr:MAG: D-beta-D-heptose 1-phosphate adenosyltransferase [Bdellovibrionales bacterium RIFOXYB1_FULL_39_21]OFZ45227.1 MAG: D-beta-D-heptose 1-phosphate adenosyltransferase [Bdellovibrionales bacterium RIFOXYC12_FULL_39_17]OFZ45581.1 MAG: D-beta-D-heptose 1-phosphate adenosyltransferase [Bdellovibrionales bacterium RIFOXYC1_FULL_39_130]OFZ71386.1 MAG: D-beta-D-heptose 1-phosphate adenosyltransferase [Bdellovibrionales bacterium RIFOXYC2_FULL_39_8]OFZ77443.1 MAG: D-beta-D-heptose 1-phosphate adeno